MRLRILRIFWCAALAVVVSVAGTGCGSGDEKISAGQVIGVWEGDGGGRVEFGKDGRFEMSGIPPHAIYFSPDEAPLGKRKLFGEGEWELGSPGEGRKRDSDVFLYLEESGSFSNGPEVGWLRVERGDENPVMYFHVDPDKEYGYEIRRVDSEPSRG